jgi:hypothetical protein
MRRAVVFVIVSSLLVLAGCELFPTISWDDIKGEWDFPDTEFNNSTITTIHLSLMDPGEGESEYKIDLSWNNFNNFYYGEGTINNNVFTGHYQVGGGSDTTQYSVTVTFSLSNNQLKAIFDGEGPLDGLILEHGTLST